MKKIILFAALAVLTTTSCKKEYTCVCVTTGTTNFQGQITTIDPQTDEVKTEKIKKKDAKSKCESMSATATAGSPALGYTSSSEVTCKLK